MIERMLFSELQEVYCRACATFQNAGLPKRSLNLVGAMHDLIGSLHGEHMLLKQSVSCNESSDEITAMRERMVDSKNSERTLRMACKLFINNGMSYSKTHELYVAERTKFGQRMSIMYNNKLKMHQIITAPMAKVNQIEKSLKKEEVLQEVESSQAISKPELSR